MIEKGQKSSGAPSTVWTLKTKLSLFTAIVLCAVIVVVSQMETVEKDKKFHHKPSHVAQRKLQAVFHKTKQNHNIKNKTMQEDSVKDIVSTVQTTPATTSTFVNYSAIILQLLKENRQLQIKFNETLQLLKKCAYSHSSSASAEDNKLYLNMTASHIEDEKHNKENSEKVEDYDVDGKDKENITDGIERVDLNKEYLTSELHDLTNLPMDERNLTKKFNTLMNLKDKSEGHLKTIQDISSQKFSKNAVTF